MKKNILCILLVVLAFFITGMVFADDEDGSEEQEVEWVVTIYYKAGNDYGSRNRDREKEYTIWASTRTAAAELAIEEWEAREKPRWEYNCEFVSASAQRKR